jgi:hypothetical protein
VTIKNLYKIYIDMDMQEVQQLKGKFTPEIRHKITWATLNNGRAFFNMVLISQDFERGARWRSHNHSYQVYWSWYASATQSNGETSQVTGYNNQSLTPLDKDAAKHKLMERQVMLQE